MFFNLISNLLTVLLLVAQASCGFIYGQPCSTRNTAIIQGSSWILPMKNNNIIDCVDITSQTKFFQMKKLNISQYRQILYNISNAQTLYADHMNLTRFPMLFVRALPNLTTIDVSGNHIRRLSYSMYKVAPNVEKLMASNNRIIIPESRPLLLSLTLHTLMLSENGIRNIFRITFSRLPALRVLYLDGNKLQTIHSICNTIPNLRYLHVGRNYIRNLPTKYMIGKSMMIYITKGQIWK